MSQRRIKMLKNITKAVLIFGAKWAFGNIIPIEVYSISLETIEEGWTRAHNDELELRGPNFGQSLNLSNLVFQTGLPTEIDNNIKLREIFETFKEGKIEIDANEKEALLKFFRRFESFGEFKNQCLIWETGDQLNQLPKDSFILNFIRRVLEQARITID
jgi:hypothetical protein